MLSGLLADLLTTHRDDPANARYLVPLPDPKQEWLANAMADANFSAAAEYLRDDATQEQADHLYEQCLIDARHMLCDDDYARMFGGGGDDNDGPEHVG